MRKKSMIIMLSMLVPALSAAQNSNSHQCTMGDLTRRIEIMYETGVTVPCEVHYYKDTEAPGERQVLWRAANEEGYCEAMTAEFIAKLSGMGWDCGMATPPAADATTMEEADTEMSDDTDALAPAEEEIELPDPETD